MKESIKMNTQFHFDTLFLSTTKHLSQFSKCPPYKG